MFSAVTGPTSQFSLLPIPAEFFELPDPFQNSAMLVLNQFANNSADLRPEHMQGILTAAKQAGENVHLLECYGVTDRAGSDKLNLALSIRRANAALDALTKALGLGDLKVTFANGLGEQFAAEYFEEHKRDGTRDPGLRGVACYLWGSMSAATDPVLRLNIAFAAPPAGGGGRRRAFLAPLHLGRLRSLPKSPFV